MKVRLKLLAMATCLMGIGYCVGSLVANYHWLSVYWLDTMASGEQNSVKHSLIYMEKHMGGDFDGAHDWIERHAISDPEWMLKNSSEDEFLFDALSMVFSPRNDNLMQRMRQLRIDELREIEKRQNLIRKYINQE